MQKIFVHYLKNGEVIRITTESEDAFNQRKLNGEPVLETDNYTDYRLLKVDMATMKVVQKSKAELEAEGIAMPDFKQPWETE